MTSLDSVIVATPTSCIDSTYDVVVTVYFTGAPCSLTLSGDQWATAPYKTTKMKKPLVIKQEGIKAKYDNGILNLTVPKAEPKPELSDDQKYIAIEG